MTILMLRQKSGAKFRFWNGFYPNNLIIWNMVVKTQSILIELIMATRCKAKSVLQTAPVTGTLA